MKHIFGILAVAVLLSGCVSSPQSLFDAFSSDTVEEKKQVEPTQKRAMPMRKSNPAPSIMTLYVFTGPSSKVAGKSKSYKEGYSIRFPLYGQDDKKPVKFSNYFEDQQ